MKRYRPLPAKAPERKDVDTSAYRRGCPSCGAPPWHRYVSKSGGSSHVHAERGADTQNIKPLPPDLKTWWRSMSAYEGSKPRRRPAGLVVP